MRCAQVLSALALRLLRRRPVAVGATAPAEDLCFAPGPYVARALRQANAKAWFALELLLAGDSLWDGLRRTGERGQALENLLRATGEAAGLAQLEHPDALLTELRTAAEAGVLTSGVIDVAEAIRDSHSDDDTPSALAVLADILEQEGHRSLEPLLKLRAGPDGAPLLVALVASLFRQTVESDPERFEDFAHLLKSDYDTGGDVRELAKVLDRDGAWLEALLEEASRIRRNGVAAPYAAPPPAADEASEHQRRGEQHSRRGEYDLAITEFTAALRADPNLAAAYDWRGDAMRLRGEYGPALADFDAAIRLAPGAARTLLNRGQTYALLGRHAEAIADFSTAIEREPGAVAFNHRGTSRAQSGDLVGAIADFTEALRLDPTSPWASYNRGEAYLAQREYIAAIADYSNTLRLNPLFTLGHVRRGDAYRLNGELDRAVADYTSALRLDPHNVPAFTNRGAAYRKLGRLEAALADFQAAVQLDRYNPRLYLQRGLAHRLKDEPERALADFDLAVRLDPSDPEAVYQRGLTNDTLQRRSAALADLSRTIELAPDHVSAFNARGALHVALGDNKSAEADFTEALRLDPSYALAYLNRASVRSKVSRFAEAIADASEALRHDPRLTSAHLVRGSAYAQIEQFEPAIADFTAVLQRDADNEQAFYLRGVARSKQGDFQGSQADLTRALQLDPSNARAFAYRGLSRQALNQPESAVSDFANAVRLDGRYAAAYCNQRASVHAARGEYEEAAADYSLVLLFDPANELAKAGRDQALRALLTRPTPRPQEPPATTELQFAPESQSPESSGPPAAPSPKPRSAPRPRPKKRTAVAAKTATMPKAPKTEAIPVPAAAATAPPREPEPDESLPEFELGPAATESGETALSVESSGEQLAAARATASAADDSDPASDLLVSEPDSEEERSRLERLEEQRREAEARAEETARLHRLAAERQRMLDEVKRKKADIDRARRAKKRVKERDDGEGFPWVQWAVRAAVAAVVLWGCFFVYDFFFGQTISRQTCYPCHGSVKFADGKPVSGGMLVLVQGDDEHEADIGQDGTFQTKTYSNTGYDGVPLGEYKVYLEPSQFVRELVPPKYRRGGQTPWIVSVKRQDNTIDLVVQ